MLKRLDKNKIILLGVVLIALTLIVADVFHYIKINKSAQSSSAVSAPSVFGKFAEKKPSVNSKKIDILFLGDLMFDRYIRQVAQRKGNDFIFQGISGMLSGHDLVVANLEGPITGNPSISLASKIGERNNYYFTFDKSVADSLEKYNIKLVNLGNNHILNFGENGLDQTEQFLDAAKVNYFGDYRGSGKRIFIKEINGFSIGFVNYDQFTANSIDNALNDISEAKRKSDFVVVYAHWGTEYATSPEDKIKNLAHDFVDSGADLVIGSHPHVVQPSEDYRGKRIYYSLGNFIFDQYEEKNTKEGLGVEVEINPSDSAVNFREISVQMSGSGQTTMPVK